jgi:hypothetical protein
MKRIIWSTLTLFFLTMFAASALHAGYRSEPWGSKTWTGSGRPPHWSSAPAPHRTKPMNHVTSRDFRKPIDSDRKVHRKHRPGGKDVFWKDKYNRWHNYSRASGSIYYQEPKAEEVIIQREIRDPIYIPVQRKPAKPQCGGRTITRNDPKTGEMIIEYVTGARDC